MSNSTPIIYAIYRRQAEAQSSPTEIYRQYLLRLEQAGINGLLFFEGNQVLVDPWIFGQELLAHNSVLEPIVALNPMYMHPFAAAKRIAGLATLYKRRVNINFIAGSSLMDLRSLGQETLHQGRYERLEAYIQVVQHLLTSKEPLNHKSPYYTTEALRLPFAIENPDLLPQYFIGGSSAAARHIASTYGCIRMQMAKPMPEHEQEYAQGQQLPQVLHFGIWARPTHQEAWQSLQEAFEGNVDHQLHAHALKDNDSTWIKDLHNNQEQTQDPNYCMLPFKNMKADCPYYVGSYEEVANIMSRHYMAGTRHFLIEVPTEEAISHLKQVSQLLHGTAQKPVSSLDDFSF